MKTKPIHLALQVTFCTLALCARGISAQEATTEQQSNTFEQATETNDFDGRASEESNYVEETKANEYNSRRTREHSDNFEATEANEDSDRTREQSNYFEAIEANEYDDRTLLDTFGQVAKEFLTKRVIPDTDAECKWDWRFVRCEPYCQCDFNFKGGDYHLGRSCRRRLQVEENCDPNAPNAPKKGVRYAILRTVQTSRTLGQRIKQKGKAAYRRLQDRVCSGLPENLTCPNSDEDMHNVPLLAWQEKLLCRKQIPECLMKMPIPQAEPISPVRSDESF
mmetsp:Transcript_21832/g.53993  ORF Transcript_21832/g.53993 Transcript_21832/m.53993 type:complete len:279 (-) Transcript_21832:168-1004(-)